MININTGRSPKVVEACKPLDEYTWLVGRIREREKVMPWKPRWMRRSTKCRTTS